MAKTLLTGGAGLVGSHVARLLAQRGDDLRLTVRRTSRLATTVPGEPGRPVASTVAPGTTSARVTRVPFKRTISVSTVSASWVTPFTGAARVITRALADTVATTPRTVTPATVVEVVGLDVVGLAVVGVAVDTRG